MLREIKINLQETYLSFKPLGLTLLIVIFTLGCGEEILADTSLTQGYQMLGIRAEPPVVRPDGQVVITAYDHHPTLSDVVYSWSLCLYSHGAAHSAEQGALNNFACLKELSLPLVDEMHPRVVIDLSERGLDLRKRLRALGQTLDTNGERRSLEEGLDIYVVLSSGDPRKELIRSVKRIHVIDAPVEQKLASNPVITGWTVTESGVANLLPNCSISVGGPESSLRFNESGDVISGALRSSVIEEITGILDEAQDKGKEEGALCSLHNESIVDLKVQIEGEYKSEWDIQEGYTYRWYISDDQDVLTPISSGGPGYGRFELDGNQRSTEIIFTVRDPKGGFTMGRQELLLVEGISIR